MIFQMKSVQDIQTIQDIQRKWKESNERTVSKVRALKREQSSMRCELQVDQQDSGSKIHCKLPYLDGMQVSGKKASKIMKERRARSPDPMLPRMLNT